jgi:hypothetical protein
LIQKSACQPWIRDRIIAAALPKTTAGAGSPTFRTTLKMRVRNISAPKGRSALGKPILVESPAARMIGVMEETDRI